MIGTYTRIKRNGRIHGVISSLLFWYQSNIGDSRAKPCKVDEREQKNTQAQEILSAPYFHPFLMLTFPMPLTYYSFLLYIPLWSNWIPFPQTHCVLCRLGLRSLVSLNLFQYSSLRAYFYKTPQNYKTLIPDSFRQQSP